MNRIAKSTFATLALGIALVDPATAAAFDLQKAAAELHARIERAKTLSAEGQAELKSLYAAWDSGTTDPGAVWEQLQADLFAVPTLTDAQKAKLKAIFADFAAGQIDYEKARARVTAAVANSAGSVSEYVQIVRDFILLAIADAGSA